MRFLGINVRNEGFPVGMSPSWFDLHLFVRGSVRDDVLFSAAALFFVVVSS